MSAFFDRHRQLMGSILVALQFGLLMLLGASAGPRVLHGELTVPSLALGGLAAALGTWTLAHNRLGNFNIHPRPKTQSLLVTDGPYRLIRHPMYSAVLLAAASMAVLMTPWLGGLFWSALALVLWIKASLEERWMREHHAGYDAYCQQSRRFVPGLF